MALFKILSNMDDTSKSLPSNYIKGYCYFDVNSGKFWIDTKNDDSTGRLPLNAYKADRDSDGNLINTSYIKTNAIGTQTITVADGMSSVPLALISNTNIESCTIRFATEQDGLLGELGIFQGYPTYKDSNGYKRLLTWDNFSINGKTPAGASYTFYAPTSSGTSNQVLVSRGNEQSPTWTNSLTLTTLNIGTTSSTTGSQLIYGRLGTDNTTKYQANTYMSGGGTYFIDIITNGATPASNRFWLSATETGSTIPINAARGLISTSDNRLFLEPGDNEVAMLAVYTNGVRAYGIHRNADSNSLKAHYYTNGTWAAGYTLLDENNYKNYISGNELTSLNASNITSGILPIERGGTGSSINNEALTNLIHQGLTLDANTALKRGIYYYQTDSVNCPVTSGYGAVDTMIANPISEGAEIGQTSVSSWVWQWGYTTSYPNPFIRYSVNAAEFSAWKKVLLEGDNILAAGANFTGPVNVTSNQSSGSVQLSNDAEGGTIRLYSKSGTYCYEFDAYNDETLRVHTATKNPNGSYKTIYWNGKTGVLQADAVYGAVWNDYAEYRSQNETIKPGYIAYCDDDGKLKLTTERLQKFEGVVSDTFGFAIGETNDCKTPLAVSGRVLVYCDPEDHFHSGDCVCAGPDGLAYRMTREEIIQFPDRIVGIVSEIPTYETWGTGNVEVNGRIWVKVR